MSNLYTTLMIVLGIAVSNYMERLENNTAVVNEECTSEN